MPAETTIPLRFDPAFIARLEAVSSKVGSNRAAVVRICVTSFVGYLERKQRDLKWADALSLLSDISILTGVATPRNRGGVPSRSKRGPGRPPIY
jgi:hypothetical protein